MSVAGPPRELASREPVVPAHRRRGARVGPAVGASAFVHVAAIVALLFWRGPARPPAPPVYRVDLVAAPPGPRAEGIVADQPPPAAEPAPTPTPPAPTPPRAETRPREMPAPTAKPEATKRPVPPPATPTPVPPKATPKPATAAKPTATPPAKAATPAGTKGGTGPVGPRAGGGPEGGRGTDVANVHVRGLEFAYPGYLANIVRQVALRFTPPQRSALTADVAFLIHRDGSVSDVRVVRRSGNYAFDLEAQGAIESAGAAHAFGPLPDGFRDDVLPVTFSFDPSVIR